MEHIFRTIGYVILLAINAVFFYFLHSHFHFMVLILMIVGPVASLVSVFCLRKQIQVEVQCIGGKNQYVKQREEAFFTIRIKNPSFFVSLESILTVEIGNSFFGTSGEQKMLVPIHMKNGYEVELPVIATLPGILYVQVKEIRIKDLMGFCKLKKNVDSREEVSVMPELLHEVSYEKNAMQQGMLESEESSKRGNDFSDVQEIREYIPGDKLMSIHWKLSAKRDILMVKDRVSMSDRQLVIVPELCNKNIECLNLILGATYSIVSQLLQDKTTVRLMYWSMNRYEYEDIRIDYPEELSNAFAKMYFESCYEDMEEAASHMALVHPEMKAYLHVSADASGLLMNIRENA